MIRATTPKHIFYFETDPSIYSRILITYQQNGSTILEKTKEDLTIEETTAPCDVEKTVYAAWFRLTQEETNKFQAGAGKQVTVQVRGMRQTSLIRDLHGVLEQVLTLAHSPCHFVVSQLHHVTLRTS